MNINVSVNSKKPTSNAERSAIKEIIGKPVAGDEKTQLFDKLPMMQPKKMGNLARLVNQVITLELNEIGDVKELSDGTKYEATKQGWKISD